MNELKVFSNEQFSSIRGVKHNGVCWLCVSDVANAIGHKNITDMVAKTDPEDKRTFPGSNRIFINEAAFYATMTRSKRQIAKELKHWVAQEVYPALRLSACDVERITAKQLEAALLDPDVLIQLATSLKEMRTKLNEATNLFAPPAKAKESENAKLAVKTDQDAITVTKFSSLLSESGICISRFVLYGWLYQNGYIDGNKVPMQEYIDQGLFSMNEYTFQTRQGVKTQRTLLITAKGQKILKEKLLQQTA